MLKENIKNIHEEFNLKNKMVLSDEGRRDFNNVAPFWICKGSLNNEKKWETPAILQGGIVE